MAHLRMWRKHVKVKLERLDEVKLFKEDKKETEIGNTYRQASLSQCCKGE